MALFNAEIGNIGLPVSEKQTAEMQDPPAKLACNDDALEKETEGMREAEPKVSLAKEAVRLWKKRRIDDALALEAAGKGEWTEHKDPDSAVLYYYNSVTKASSWTKPPDFVEPEIGNIGKWTVSKDPGSGHLYYFHKESGQSSWERPADFNAAVAPAVAVEGAMVAAGATAGAIGTAAAISAVGPDHASDRDSNVEVDEVFDLVADTESPSPDRVYARVLAESDDGIGLTGFTMCMNTPFCKLMAAWSDYQELPVESVYFTFGEKVLDPGETPADHGWTAKHGTFKIEAKPCEECTDSEAEEEHEQKRAEVAAEVARWKKEQKKQRKKDKGEKGGKGKGKD